MIAMGGDIWFTIKYHSIYNFINENDVYDNQFHVHFVDLLVDNYFTY